MVKAKNNIRRLSESGHITVPDPKRPGHLKIINNLDLDHKLKRKIQSTQ